MSTATCVSRFVSQGIDGEPLSSSMFGLRLVNPRSSAILLVDDDPDQLRLLQAMIGSVGYNVTAVDSPSEALALLRERPFRAVVTDYRMPEMNGFELIEAARTLDADWSVHTVPVIVLTACGDDIEFMALEHGADMFCEKSRANSLLIKQIRFLLEM